MTTGLENLKIYQMAKDLELKVHAVVKNFPKEEKFRSVDQLSRSSSSITNNIAEAYYKSSPKQKIHIFRNIVITESEETRSNILRCANKSFLSETAADELADNYIELRKAIFGYIKFLKNSSTHQLINSSTHNGQLLIESGIAISILVIGLLGIFGLLSRSLGLNNVVSSQYIASNLASEGIEVVKNLIDANIIQYQPWNQGISTGSYEVNFASQTLEPNQNRFLLFDSSDNTYNYQNGQPTFFKRVIEIENIGADEIRVNSKVNWQIKGGSYSVNLEDHFFNWRP
jgi:four helix bundle protein